MKNIADYFKKPMFERTTARNERGELIGEIVDKVNAGRVGTKYKPVVAELKFDLQATLPGDGVSGGGGDEVTKWTPVVGTICVIGDVSGTL